ncbi:lipid II:glycine glycyltransferase FemX [Streptomyces olivoreticuli]
MPHNELAFLPDPVSFTYREPDHHALQLVELTPEEHLEWIEGPVAESLGGVSFMQCPSWGRIKEGWRAESVGWRSPEGRLVGAALVLSRSVPKLGRRFCYLPEGPGIDWSSPYLSRWLDPLVEHLHARGAFTIRMGPPLQLRCWRAKTVRDTVRAKSARLLRDVVPDVVDPIGATVAGRLRDRGWRPAGEDAQPRFVFQLPLAGRSVDDLWDGLNSQWRRNIKKAHESQVILGRGGLSDLPEFYRLLQATQGRNGFDLGRKLPYYRRQFAEMNAERDGRMQLFRARHHGETLAAHTLATVGRRTWYVHGANADHNRTVRPSNALQWSMITHAHAGGATLYDMRGVKDCLNPSGSDYGLLRWKLGTGGHVAENLGEWELVLSRPLHLAFRTYMATRHR